MCIELLFTLFTVTRFAMHRNCVKCSFALAALGVLKHSARKHFAEQWQVNSNVTVTAANYEKIRYSLVYRKKLLYTNPYICFGL